MATLTERLAALRQAAAARRPPEQQAILHAATEALRAPEVLGRIIRPGAALPAFALADQHGRMTDSAAVVAAGPAIVSVFRGFW